MAERDKFGQVAIQIPYDNTDSGLLSEDVKSALDEIHEEAQNASRAYTLAQYNGNANTGRYLEFFSGISSNDAPLYTPGNAEVITIVAATTSNNSTCTIGFYDKTGPGPSGTLLYTLTFSNQKRVITTSSLLFTIPATGELTIKITSGSISKPHLYFIVKGG